MYVFMYACMYVCIGLVKFLEVTREIINQDNYAGKHKYTMCEMYVCLYVFGCLYVCMYMYVYVCMYVCMYV